MNNKATMKKETSETKIVLEKETVSSSPSTTTNIFHRKHNYMKNDEIKEIMTQEKKSIRKRKRLRMENSTP